MKILQLGKFWPIRGGVERVMYDLMLGLGKRGVHCDMMCAETSGRGTVRKLDTRSRVLSFHTWRKVASTTIAPSMVKKLRAVASNYDLIHVHHPDPMAAVALRLSGYEGPVVLHWHADIIKNKALMKLYGPLQDWLLKRADVVVGTTPAYIEQSPGLRRFADKTQCIPIGISPLTEDLVGAAMLRERFGHRKMVFSVGRLVPYKGYHHLVQAASVLPDNYVVVIGGDGPLRSELEKLRDSLGLRDKVHFIGRVPDEQLEAYYSACDIFCLPSVMKTEAFGIVQIEAMSLGKPVVATKIKGSGTAWVNDSGVSGLNVEPGSPLELARAIHTIGSNLATYDRMSRGARERFDSEFTIDTMVDRCHELYNRVIACHNKDKK